MTYNTITVDVDAGIATITLNRPERLNAWTYEMGAELQAAIEAGNADNAVEAFVVTGAGRGFCAGADVKDLFAAQADGENVADARASRNWVELVRDSKPMVAAVNGAAIGVGLTQILPMDFLIASSTAKLSCRFIKMGVVPELASSQFLIARCGLGLASELMLSGRTVGAEEARELRLIDKLVAPEDLLDEAKAIAKSMGENPQSALRVVKSLITQNMMEPDLNAVQRRELEALTVCYESAEHKEAIAAFLEKREPNFAAVRESERA